MTETKNYLITGHRGGVGQALVSQLENSGHRAIGWDLPELDVTDAAEVETALDDVESTYGSIDALIHTAGVLLPDTALHPDAAAITTSLQVNLFGTVNVCSAVARRMTKRGEGAIVAITSNAATTPRKNMSAYGLSKAAANSWLRTLALEVAEYGVRCNIVSPGSTNTPMLRGMWQESDESAKVINGNHEEYRLGIPLRRIADPADIARTCIFLTSSDARHITMHDLRVDGGATFDQ